MATYHHGDLNSALLAAGEEVLAERGLQGFTLRECARRAGVSHAAPRHHFQDVSGFLTAIAGRGFDRLCSAIRDSLAQVDSTVPVDADTSSRLVAEFHAVICGYFEFAQQWPEHFRIMFRSDLLHSDSSVLLGSANKTFLELTNVVLRQRGEPELTANDYSENDGTKSSGLEIEANMPLVHDIVIAWSHAHGFAHLRLEGQLNMVCADAEAEVLRRVSQRLSELVQQQCSYL